MLYKYKSLLSIILILNLLAGCGGGSNGGTTNTDTTSTTITPKAGTTDQNGTATIQSTIQGIETFSAEAKDENGKPAENIDVVIYQDSTTKGILVYAEDSKNNYEPYIATYTYEELISKAQKPIDREISSNREIITTLVVIKIGLAAYTAYSVYSSIKEISNINANTFKGLTPDGTSAYCLSVNELAEKRKHETGLLLTLVFSSVPGGGKTIGALLKRAAGEEIINWLAGKLVKYDVYSTHENVDKNKRIIYIEKSYTFGKLGTPTDKDNINKAYKITVKPEGCEGTITTGISYSGLTSQATVDSSNAKTLISDAYSGGSGSGVAFGKPGGEGQSSLYAVLYNTFDETVQNLNKKTNLNKPLKKTETVSGSDLGPCGGTSSYTITIDDTVGSFSGTVNLSNFCSLGTTVNGAITVIGSYNSYFQIITSITFSTTGLSVTSAGSSFTISGTFDGSSGKVTANCSLRNNTTSKVYKVENLTYTVTSAISCYGAGNCYAVTISGRFYHPDYGYVDIATPTIYPGYSMVGPPTELRFLPDGKYPYSGVITITGANNTGAALMVESSSQYTVSADLNGDGTYETTIGTYSWGT